MKNFFRKVLSFYLESIGFLVALLFFLFTLPVTALLKITGLSLEEEW